MYAIRSYYEIPLPRYRKIDSLDDLHGNSSTATRGRIAGFGGAPNMGADARGRRHASPAWLKAGREGRGDIAMPRGQKLVARNNFV